MPLDYVVDSLESIEEGFQDAYEEKDGKFYLNIDKHAEMKAAALKVNATNLKKEKDKLRAEFDGFKKKFADISDEDLPSFLEWKERRALLGDDAEQDTGEGKSKKSAEDLAKVYQAQLKAEREKWERSKADEINPLKDAVSEWQGKWKAERLTNRLKEYAITAGVFKEELDTFVDLMLFKRLFDLGEDEEVIFLQDGDPSPISAEKAINETLRDKFKRFYEAPAQGGSGSSGGGKRRSNGVDYSKMSASQRMEAARKAGITK